MRLKIIACMILCLILGHAHADEEGMEPAGDEAMSPPSGDDGGYAPSSGDGAKKSFAINEWVKFSGNMGVVSDYMYRGQTQTFSGPALQGKFLLNHKKDEGPYAGLWGSNVSNTIAANGAGLELDLFAGYIYKYNPDLSLKLEVRNSRYPGSYAPLATKDRYDVLEVIPAVTYNLFSVSLLSVSFAYSVNNRRGVNQNFAPTYPVFLKPNGNSKGSWYAEANLDVPIPNTNDKLKFNLLCGYWYARNYTALNYAVYGTGLNYKLPDNWSGVILSVNASATTANKKYYKVANTSGGVKNTVAPKVWLGIVKEF